MGEAGHPGPDGPQQKAQQSTISDPVEALNPTFFIPSSQYGHKKHQNSKTKETVESARTKFKPTNKAAEETNTIEEHPANSSSDTGTIPPREGTAAGHAISHGAR